jgi:phosphatidylglycerophosphate synthase
MYYLVNTITIYRLASAPVLIYFALSYQMDVFKWLLAVSFLTDAIDGPIARRYKVTSVMGSKLDSVSDDMTVLAGIMGLIVFRMDFLRQEIVPVALLLALFLVQVSLAFLRFRRMTSFHTYAAKAAAILQGIFLILAFFLPEPSGILFYAAVIITALDLLEEIILVLVIPDWATDVKGLYWVMKGRRR